MTEIMVTAMDVIHQHDIILFVVLLIIADTFFGCLRAIKQGKFNSCVGIDGAIRKVAMIGCLLFLILVDTAVHINLIAFVPEEILVAMGIGTVGTTEFFGLLFVGYESISILKNMALCGLPVKSIWSAVKKFLGKYTTELPDEDELKE